MRRGVVEKAAGALMGIEEADYFLAQRFVAVARPRDVVAPRVERQRQCRLEDISHARPVAGLRWH